MTKSNQEKDNFGTGSEFEKKTAPVIVQEANPATGYQVSIKTEGVENDDPKTETYVTASEFSSTCLNCGQCLTVSLHYLDHQLVCGAVKDTHEASKVKIKNGGVSEPSKAFQRDENFGTADNFRMIKEETCEAIKEEGESGSTSVMNKNVSVPTMMLRNNFPLDKNYIQANGDDLGFIFTDNRHLYKNAKEAHAVPKLLIQNATCSREMHISSTTEQHEVLVKCLYCSETFLSKDKVPYSRHMQQHLNKLNKRRKFDVKNEVKVLNDYFKNAFTKPRRISAKICKEKSCSSIFVDMSVAMKHYLTKHDGHQFVCSKYDCHRVFPDNGSLRSHEIVDHVRQVPDSLSEREGHFKTTSDASKNSASSSAKSNLLTYKRKLHILVMCVGMNIYLLQN